MVVGDILSNNVRLFPDKMGIVDESHRFSWDQVNQRVNCLANAMKGLGLKRGDRAAMISENCHQCAEFLFAVARAGFMGTFPSYRLGPGNLANIIADCQPTIVFVQDKYLPDLDEIVRQTGDIDHIIVMGESDSYEQLITSHDPTEPQVEVDEEDGCILQYTTGSTGRPKGVELTHRNIITNCILRLFFGRQPEACVYMSAVPKIEVENGFYSIFDGQHIPIGLKGPAWHNYPRRVERFKREFDPKFLSNPPQPWDIDEIEKRHPELVTQETKDAVKRKAKR